MARLLAFKLNRGGVKALAVGPECRRMVNEHAQVAKTFAETLSSGLRSDEEDKRHYQDSFEVEVEVVHGITPEWPLTRAVGRLANTAPHAIIVEFGTARTTKDGRVVQTRGYGILSRTLDFLNSIDGRLDPE
ncbi:hypothetical protein KBX50_05200 [Micromonospora sp. C51]|uniref:hypothetical protein n=1 Tax=Micromonospora sp. C51 TaxID=2824879 RepID=UPI001B37EB8E|nr:hypothetical protein [Micromonospora sp. C51]MBQ1047855.1 hypothetical protein [Micromonospora sp. C51]